MKLKAQVIDQPQFPVDYPHFIKTNTLFTPLSIKEIILTLNPIIQSDWDNEEKTFTTRDKFYTSNLSS